MFVFPSHKKQCVDLSKAYCYFLWEKKFLAVRRVSLLTRHEYRVDRPLPVTWLGKVWEPPPPPPQYGMGRLFNPRFPGLKIKHRYAVTQRCDWHCGSHPSSSTSTTTSPPASSRLEHRVSVFLFSRKCRTFPGHCFCPLLVSLSKFIVRVVLYLALWLPVWLPRLLPTGVATGQSLGP